MVDATCIINSKAIQGCWVVQRVVWALPNKSKERPDGLKYRLFCGDATRCLVR
jgi:hypothetical protein